MGAHEMMLAQLTHQASEPVRERQLQRQRMIQEAKATESATAGAVTWFGGIKATASFLRDAAREAVAQRSMSEARG